MTMILTNWIGVPDKSFTISNNSLIYKIINKFYKQILSKYVYPKYTYTDVGNKCKKTDDQTDTIVIN